MDNGSTTPAAGGTPTPSTDPQLGDTLLVQVATGIWRPLIVTDVRIPLDGGPLLIDGTLFCQPEDHTLTVFRGWSDGHARVTGRPDRHLTIAFAEGLTAGARIGQWRRR